ncbi:3-dehydroquinate synthase [Sphingomicrobium flavum]|uniref:3-dehydroquinate synthase n=1 Tax=Sphingomicrobium flavum TaxID=1229164 RepID=UPI0021ADEF78|nr:3-dehydroquinate synthase [Sphingomicrobium flavum]
MSRIAIDDGAGGHSLALLGPLAQHADHLAQLAKGKPLICVSDELVWSLHGPKLSAICEIDPILIPRGEEAKAWPTLITLIGELAARNHGRDRALLALGGGSIGDTAGLAAALYKRGCPIVHIPTTLLAQVDSAVGGKTAIDAEGEKNLVGTFHAPALIIADPAMLTTLDQRQMRAGMAEIVKYGAIADAAFFRWVEQHGRAVLDADPDACTEAAHQCITMKAAAVAGDVQDLKGQRALLNFGHSFGHAIESVAGLGTVLHGEAVAVGMVMAARFSAVTDRCAPAVPDRLESLLTSLGLPTRLDQVGLGGRGEQLFGPMRKDKKNLEGGMTLILLEDIGAARLVNDVSPSQLQDFLSSS